jgi:hypothetical protein
LRLRYGVFVSASSASTSASLVSKDVTSRAIVSPVLGARSERAERVDQS